MKIPWRISDLIDLEYFLHADENSVDEYDPGKLHQRDREIFLQYIQPALIKNSSPIESRRAVIKLWLDHRRLTVAEDTGEPPALPGTIFAEIFKFMRYGATAAGVFMGFLLALSLLGYSGTRPVNISVLFCLLVLLQVILVLFSGGMFALRRFKADTRCTSVVYAMLRRFLVKIFQRFTSRVINRVPARQRNSIEAAAGLVMGENRIYGSLFFWPLFIIIQIFAAACNGGVLAGILLRVLTTDLAFGWQSTIQLGSQVVYLMVRTISLPWSFFLPAGMAHPSLAQIQGSRMVLKDGIYQLATPALISWWPFLCLAIVFYALLPRLILWAGGWFAQNLALGRIGFTHAACNQLIRRMKTSILSTRSIEPEHQKNSFEQISFGLDAQKPAFSKSAQAYSHVLALVPAEILDQSTDDELSSGIKACTGLDVQAVIPITFDPRDFDISAERIRPKENDPVPPDIFILQEAWQPPIKETVLFIRQIRNILGPSPSILIGLIGKPGADTLFTPVKKENWQVWKHKISAMGDPYLHVSPIGGRHD